MNYDKFKNKDCVSGRSKNSWTLDELKNICRELGLRVSGNKSDLCKRIEEFFNHKHSSSDTLETLFNELKINDTNLSKTSNSKNTSTEVVNVKVAYIRPMYQNLKEWTRDENNLYIGRAGVVFVDGERFPKKASPWANPFKVGKDYTREESINEYKKYIIKKINDKSLDLNELAGKRLGCWCKPESCHGDVLVKLLKRE